MAARTARLLTAGILALAAAGISTAPAQAAKAPQQEYFIKNVNSGMCLAMPPSEVQSSSSQQRCMATVPRQRWLLNEANGYVSIYTSGACVVPDPRQPENGAAVFGRCPDGNGTPEQQWRFTDPDGDVHAGGSFALTYRPRPDWALHVRNASTAENDGIIVGAYAPGAAHHRWTLVRIP